MEIGNNSSTNSTMNATLMNATMNYTNVITEYVHGLIDINVSHDSSRMLLYSCITALLVFNVALHSTGCYLLHSTIKKGRGYIQQLFIMNLSVSELLKNLLKLFRYTIQLTGLFYTLPQALNVAVFYVRLNHIWGVYMLSYLSMLYITADRLLATTLNLKYKLYITELKAKVLVVFSWVVVLLFSFSLSILHHTTGFVIDNIHAASFYAVSHIFYTVLAIFTYLSIFGKFTRSRRLLSEKDGHEKTEICRNKQGTFDAFRHSRFFICVLIITSYLILTVIPGLVYIKLKTRSSLMKYSVHICYILSDTVDACIYIFLQRTLRSLLMEKIKFVCNIKQEEKMEHQKKEKVQMLRLKSSIE